ncbi:hypothetical protein SDC9_199490 [bioreactor metagenome]|uniref:Uncharacterized protein n=1 Tax=bioreactor metagenome TaxID=1076179 RepID=A0A645IL67_9ZZZZ
MNGHGDVDHLICFAVIRLNRCGTQVVHVHIHRPSAGNELDILFVSRLHAGIIQVSHIGDHRKIVVGTLIRSDHLIEIFHIVSVA